MHIQFKLCQTVCKIHKLALKALKLNLKRKQQYKHPRSHPNTDRHTHTQFSHCYSTKSFVYMKSLTLGPFSHNTDKINYFMFLKKHYRNDSRYLSTEECKQLMELLPSRIADPETWENYSLCQNCHRQNHCRRIQILQNP